MPNMYNVPDEFFEKGKDFYIQKLLKCCKDVLPEIKSKNVKNELKRNMIMMNLYLKRENVNKVTGSKENDKNRNDK